MDGGGDVGDNPTVNDPLAMMRADITIRPWQCAIDGNNVGLDLVKVKTLHQRRIG